jgi:hypothetical protein
MSAELLIKRNHFHDIEDDRESALYVLLWTALRYTKHSQLVDDISVPDFLAAFDEARPDGSGGFTGGSLKRSFLRGNGELHFDNRPQLDALAGHLCRAIGARYTAKPGPEAPAALAEYHNNSLQLLRTENWFVDIMQKFLNSDGWPSDDKAEPQETIVEATTSNKRGFDQASINGRNEKRFRSSRTQ